MSINTTAGSKEICCPTGSVCAFVLLDVCPPGPAACRVERQASQHAHPLNPPLPLVLQHVGGPWAAKLQAGAVAAAACACASCTTETTNQMPAGQRLLARQWPQPAWWCQGLAGHSQKQQHHGVEHFSGLTHDMDIAVHNAVAVPAGRRCVADASYALHAAGPYPHHHARNKACRILLGGGNCCTTNQHSAWYSSLTWRASGSGTLHADK